MLVNRKLLRRFEYVSIAGNTMGTIEVTKITSPELGDFVIYQYVRNHTDVVRNTGDYEGQVSTTTETVVDFPKYSEALAYMASIETSYIQNSGYRTNLPTHPGTTIGATLERNSSDPLFISGPENKDDI